MRWKSHTWRLGACLALSVLCAGLAAQEVRPRDVVDDGTDARSNYSEFKAAERKRRNAEIEILIPQLGSDRFAEREAAEERLISYGDATRAALERAMESPDVEIVFRARRILLGLPELTHVVVDALGEPIPWSDVIVRRTAPDAAGGEGRDRLLAESDEQGRIPMLDRFSPQDRFVVELVHPEFGNAVYEIAQHATEAKLRFPLVRAGTQAGSRSVLGAVVGEDGRPVAGAAIRVQHVRTPGEGLINNGEPNGVAITDQEGRFRIYMPNENRRGERGDMIPANSRYQLSISTPNDETYFPASGSFSNLSENLITLKRSEQFHRFAFETAEGKWIDDPEILQNTAIVYEGDASDGSTRVPLERSDIASGRRLFPGRYLATGYFNGKSVTFKPLEVTADSPVELRFRLPPAVAFRGRVLHGMTGEPVGGALVVGWRSTSRGNLALLSHDDWRVLSEAPSNPSLEHPAVQVLRRYYGVLGLVRADADGWFEITQASDEEFYGLMAFGHDFVPFKVRIFSLDKSGEGPVAAGEFFLFPAAKVTARPIHENGNLAVSPKWLLSEDGQPEWIDRFHAATDGQNREFEYIHWLEINQSQPLYVPAGVRLRLMFESPYDDAWAPLLVEPMIQLAPGETREIGDLRFARALPAVVRVTDPNGQPLEGIPVRIRGENGVGSVAHNTDANGLAHFHMNPNSRGQFYIASGPALTRLAPSDNLRIAFEASDTPPEAPFEFTLTDEQRRILLETPRPGLP
jgi:protocatechuate 3,4-dioxygenase beta subunit